MEVFKSLLRKKIVQFIITSKILQNTLGNFQLNQNLNHNQIQTFRELSLMHMDVLSNFKLEHPTHIFPPLYKELFSLDAQQDLLT